MLPVVYVGGKLEAFQLRLQEGLCRTTLEPSGQVIKARYRLLKNCSYGAINLAGSFMAVFTAVGQIPTKKPLPFLHEIRTETDSGGWFLDLSW